ncbi:hemerythrin HHE cation binding domain-containing protein [Murinocardiopsis flavida]|uniref:Hemerythrin HHE cation binding domain-containing protein n=1 Tax=Murinocardiopsis flavida TaxID=645275 RepID=A0A2P8CT03_9ACTN|nr:hemerythrin domain-containing protein [Murinocardiopsis flavida]PSK88080.1 hemerythrin HHE cation binding domain-containing protein [Murinocardiopsis flavida]
MEASTGPGARIAALGNQLVDVHIRLRDDLERLRADVDSFLDGGGDLPRDLRSHCLAFCSALTRHHTGEDDGAFPALAERHPELRPVLEQLQQDHHVVTGILRSLEVLVDGLGERTAAEDAQRVRAELDGLSAILETHFRYEEKKLAAVLDTLPVAPSPAF